MSRKKPKSPRMILYGIWQHMNIRCSDPKYAKYADYGGRGIAVCERWKEFENFFQDMSPRPAGMTLDRKDNDKGYSKENCRWVDRRTQILNRRYTIYITLDGETMCAKDWAKRRGIPYQTVRERLRRGWPHDLAVNTPSNAKPARDFKKVPPQNSRVMRDHWPKVCDRGHSLTDESNVWRVTSGRPHCKVCIRGKDRIRHGWPEEMAFTTPPLDPKGARIGLKRRPSSAGESRE